MQDCGKIERNGVIISANGEHATVRIGRMAACNGCSASGKCAAAGGKEFVVEVNEAAPGALSAGDNVVVKITPETGRMAVIAGFLAPLLILLAALALASSASDRLVVQSGVPILAILLYYVLLYMFRSRINERFRFEISKKRQESGF